MRNKAQTPSLCSTKKDKFDAKIPQRGFFGGLFLLFYGFVGQKIGDGKFGHGFAGGVGLDHPVDGGFAAYSGV